MRIRINTCTGVKPNDLDNINGLNHYIGMKRDRARCDSRAPRSCRGSSAALIVTGLLVALRWRRRRCCTRGSRASSRRGRVGLVDFWRWEYDYGHNLDFEHAIIKIPGMNYQPPLIGSKQLLNFTAVSWPDVGGWLAFIAFALAHSRS